MGGGRRSGAHLWQPAQPVRSVVQSSLPPTPGKSLSGKVFQVQNLGRRSFPEGSPRPPGNGCLSLPLRARVLDGRPWEGDLLTLRSEPSAGVLGIFVTPPPSLGLAASSSALEGIEGWRSLQCRGLFMPPRMLPGSATSWPPVSPTHQRPAPRAPSGAADPATGPWRVPDSDRSDCIAVVLAVSHGGSAPPSYLGSRRCL